MTAVRIAGRDPDGIASAACFHTRYDFAERYTASGCSQQPTRVAVRRLRLGLIRMAALAVVTASCRDRQPQDPNAELLALNAEYDRAPVGADSVALVGQFLLRAKVGADAFAVHER